MDRLSALTEVLSAGEDLDAAQACGAAQALAGTEESPEAKAAFLKQLAAKGETAVEVAAFAETMRGLATDPGVGEWADEAIDIVGTGGDKAGTFNISTATAFLVAATGVPVFKHGNRSITSKCGSADLIEAVGIPLDLSHEQLRASLRELNFCFFFAPAFHPAFKEIMPVRKALAAEGQRTVFNILGPLINPGRPAFELMGVYAESWVDPLADALGALGLRSGLVVHGRPAPEVALDELSCAGDNRIAGFGALTGESGVLAASDAGLPACAFDDLKGGTAEDNLATLRALLSGGAVPQGLVDTVVLNAGAALWVAGREETLSEGVLQARATIESGAAKDWLERAAAFTQGL